MQGFDLRRKNRFFKGHWFLDLHMSKGIVVVTGGQVPDR